MKLQTLCLFAGLGGTAYAARDILGLDVVGAVEWAPGKTRQAAADTLRLNGFPTYNEDVRAIDWRKFGRVDVILGGPPCQPFSVDGRNAGASDERDCVPDFVAAVAALRPRFFVMENVKGLSNPRHADYLAGKVADLTALGYNVTSRVLDASDYRVPQSRKRTFVIGVRADLGDVKLPIVAAHKITMAEALGWTIVDAQRANYRAPEKAHATSIDDLKWVFERPAPTVIGSFRPDVAAKPGYRSTGDGPRQNAVGSVSTTLEERLTLQGLPRDWKIAGSKAERDLQVGNTCPPLLMASIIAANLSTINLEA